MSIRAIPSYTDVPCRRRGCNAEPGQPCRQPSGALTTNTHAVRERDHENAWLVSQGYEPLWRRP